MPTSLSFPSSDIEDVSSEPSSTPSVEQDENHFHYEVYGAYYLVVKNLHHFTEYTIEVSRTFNNERFLNFVSTSTII